MALEAMMQALITSLDANTAAVLGKQPAPGAVAGTAKPPKAAPVVPKAPAINFDVVKAAAVKVKEKSGAPVSKKMILDFGKSESLNAVKPENYGALLSAFEAHLAEEDDATDDAAEDDL